MTFEHIFKSLVENTNDIIMVMDSTPLQNGGPFIVYVNPAFEKLLGYKSAEIVGKNPSILQGPDTDKSTRLKIREAITLGNRIRTQILNYTKTKQAIWMDINIVPLKNSRGEIEYFAAIERDLTDHKQLESHLEHLASTDMLTDLPNRLATMERAEREFIRAKRFHRPLSVVMIDVDYFKSINDQHGHAAGDHVLQQVGRICSDTLRETDLLGRIGGEEFILLLPDMPKANAEHVAERIRARLERATIRYLNKEISVTASFGVSSFSPCDSCLKELIERADSAMYQAKHGGRNQVRSAA